MLTLDEVKAHLRVDIADDDALITSLINAAYQYAQSYTNSIILGIQKTDKLDCFTNEIELKNNPVQSITSITYFDANDVQQTQATYFLDLRELKAVLKPSDNSSWPDTNGKYENVVITYQSGFSVIPEQINQAVLLIIGSMYEQRENHIIGVSINSVPLSAESLLNKYKILSL